MIVQAFLRWAETAKAGDRSKAATALAQAYLRLPSGSEEQRSALLAMTYLLDDPSPRVRLALAKGLADSPHAPRAVVAALAEDQPEIACTVIARSPALNEADLVDLAGRGDGLTRGMISSRPDLPRGASAAIAEIGDEAENILLLENPTAQITRVSLRRITERLGALASIRNLLLDREDLPADARQLLVEHVSIALASSFLVRTALSQKRIDWMTREAEEAATVAIAGIVPPEEILSLAEHLRASGRLTPAFLIQALCAGKVDFFVGAVVVLSGLTEQRVRPILATGRRHAVRALFEACGLSRALALVFVEAVLLWRQAAAGHQTGSISSQLIDRLSHVPAGDSPVSEMLGMIEKMQRSEIRASARAYASNASLAA
ncbi:DUF2336 domain-containing protein [Neorhizobium lilium]|uniref:DUF2336 domain-containing protein n=1 Tax=Neorhizobium lilium TaxID=2503024 RepID=A0A3S3S2W4_9HYPH|nr:DUF2336 domain-containing protein [Neorhizobium lilium]RWX75398.1 DUF2336 domain-containing protein [Neorhizobium lilium]